MGLENEYEFSGQNFIVLVMRLGILDPLKLDPLKSGPLISRQIVIFFQTKNSAPKTRGVETDFQNRKRTIFSRLNSIYV